MFGKRQKEVVLTDTTCGKIEDLRLAIEVLTGGRVRLKKLDFNTGHGQVFVGNEVCDIDYVDFYHGDKFEFCLSGSFGKGERFIARYDNHPDHDEVRVYNMTQGVDRNEKADWIVGTSATERHTEPLFGNRNRNFTAVIEKEMNS